MSRVYAIRLGCTACNDEGRSTHGEDFFVSSPLDNPIQFLRSYLVDVSAADLDLSPAAKPPIKASTSGLVHVHNHVFLVRRPAVIYERSGKGEQTQSFIFSIQFWNFPGREIVEHFCKAFSTSVYYFALLSSWPPERPRGRKGKPEKRSCPGNRNQLIQQHVWDSPQHGRRSSFRCLF